LVWCIVFVCFFFFFQAEDGIRDSSVTGVQTCALPIYGRPIGGLLRAGMRHDWLEGEIGRLAAQPPEPRVVSAAIALQHVLMSVRSEERRVGKECRSRWVRSN